MIRKSLFTTLFLLCFLPSFGQKRTKEIDLIRLYDMMQGEFSSALQAAEDSSYFDISLIMTGMWENRPGYWLYVEQALATSIEKPYRQRVYQLLDNNGRIESRVYTIPNGERYFGAWKDVRKLDQLTIDSLELRDGCSIFLEKINKYEFAGSTLNKSCESNLKGASYATSIVSIYKDMIISWDRGFDKNDHQVWGAEKGGYIFIKYKENE
jgi:Protein of unknown function (DUF1001).